MTFRYLFLDIDGVLHSADLPSELEDLRLPLPELQAAGLFTHLWLLCRLLEPHPEVRLIVHSAWRQFHGDEELRLLFGPLADKVVGATARELDRQLSIRESVARLSLGPAQYRVLDDQAELLDDLGDVVIPCDSALGLADMMAQRSLVSWLEANGAASAPGGGEKSRPELGDQPSRQDVGQTGLSGGTNGFLKGQLDVPEDFDATLPPDIQAVFEGVDCCGGPKTELTLSRTSA